MTKQQNYSRSTRWAVAAFIVVALACLVVVLTHGKANAALYMCDEAWQAPHSDGAHTCRDHGWTVKSRMVLDPTNQVRSLVGLKPCRTEDQESACYWRAMCQGNGFGDSFVRLNHRTWFVSFGTYECQS